jgi:hypothetical protein
MMAEHEAEGDRFMRIADHRQYTARPTAAVPRRSFRVIEEFGKGSSSSYSSGKQYFISEGNWADRIWSLTEIYAVTKHGVCHQGDGFYTVEE